jgi:hypothetical protein
MTAASTRTGPLDEPPTGTPDRHSYQPPDLTGTGITFRPEPVGYHGRDRGFVWRGRRAVAGRGWPAARPEDCTHTGSCEWLAGGALLVCPGCGLDCT